ncbi:hypothetical protein KA183_11025 [bacterium]|nr:hypothetical protein [bacterium]
MEDFEQPENPKQEQNTEKEINHKVWNELEHGQKNNPEKKPNEDGKDPNNDGKDKPKPRQEAEPSSDGQSSTGGAPEVKEPENPEPSLPDAEHAF